MAERVSRETPPPVPASARGVFAPDQLALAKRYAGWLTGAGVLRGLIGPREGDRIWTRHLLNCAVLGEVVPPQATVADLGSGAGLPGLVLAIARPDVQVSLVEPLLRRTRFLEEVVADLALANCAVHRARAEELHGAAAYDVVTARAVAPLARLLGLSMPLVAPAGALVAMKGASVAEEVQSAARELQALGCSVPEVVTVGAALIDPPTTVVRVVRGGPARVG